MERLALRPGVGLRLEDPFGGPLGEGLKVSIVLADSGLPPAPLTSTPSGHWAAHGLPGLRAWEGGEVDDPAPLARLFEVSVADPRGRVLPTRFRVSLPQNRLAHLTCPGALPADPPIEHFPIPLFSAPARSAPAGWAAVRASLRELPPGDPDTATPAAWALVRVLKGATLLAQGLADARGEVMLAFPYPEPPDAGATPRSAFDHRWGLTLSVCYARLDPKTVPLLCTVLAQPAKSLARSVAGDPPVVDPGADLSLSLRYGQPLAVATTGARALFVQP